MYKFVPRENYNLILRKANLSLRAAIAQLQYPDVGSKKLKH